MAQLLTTSVTGTLTVSGQIKSNSSLAIGSTSMTEAQMQKAIAAVTDVQAGGSSVVSGGVASLGSLAKLSYTTVTSW